MDLVNPDGRIRIKDIADMTNVSPGTVDRVIHNRGGVAPESKERIEKILKKLNFKPNKMAQMLAIKKDHKLISLLPETTPSGYWSQVITGIKRAELESADYRVKTELLQFNQYNAAEFETIAGRLLEMNPDGVLLAPFFKKEVLRLIQELEERGVPYVFVDSNVEGADSLAYYGQHSHRSGYMAAKFMFQGLPENTTVLLVHMQRGGGMGANQTANREAGFRSYIEKFGLESKYNLQRVDLSADNVDKNYAILKEVFSSSKNISGVITFNSRIYRIAEYIEENLIKNVRLIGYDLLERNVKHLEQGTVECLIAQRPQLQGYYGLMALTNFLLFEQRGKPVCYMPIDILYQENIMDYKVYPFDVE
ncbi:MAG: LacI family DNA-binding transcriptional regulator [Prevotellaceae bacterium]|jgi:LacI family transcriptional regulator|nr:LacI family DNA-binding transcriptional regulator [Prevotellaceae bacterium]